MAQELRLKVNDEPTWFNKEAFIGLLLAGPIGGVIGGWIGNERMEREKLVGKRVSSEPSFWNKDTLIGGLIGDGLGGVVGYIAGVAIGGWPGVAVGVAIWLGGILIGAYLGDAAGEKRRQREYEGARQQQIVQHISQSVSPEIGQAVEYRMKHDKQWAKQALEEKLLQAAPEQQR